MKKDIHPKYGDTVIKCACGNELKTKSTVPGEIHIELCSACHPFFTGKQKFVDTAGRVDKFRARMEAKKNIEKKDPSAKNAKKGQLDNKQKLAEIKKELNAAKPKTVDQTATSNEEIAAADELMHAKTKKAVTSLDKDTKKVNG